MIYLPIVILLLSYGTAVENNGVKKKDHKAQKKQFVNFVNNDGSYGKGYVGLTNDDTSDYNDVFRGRSFGGGSFDGAMQLSENRMGGLALQGDEMESAFNSLLGGSNPFASYGDSNGMNELPARSDATYANSLSSQPMQPQEYSNDGFQPPIEYNSYGNVGSQDMQPSIYSPQEKLDENVNLGDTMNAGVGQGSSNNINDILQRLTSNFEKQFPSLKDPTKAKGVGSSNDNEESLNGEIGELDSSDAKLQKLLEASITPENNNGDNSNSATNSNFLNSLMNPQGQAGEMNPTQAMNPTENNANSNMHFNYGTNLPDQALQNSALNQLAGTMVPGSAGAFRPITVHLHASDKPGDKNTSPHGDDSRAVAQQAQETAMKQHKAKLAKLKKRLALLREKLQELEEEQAKKSTSNKSNDPKQVRNAAIKKLLIRNLRLAALIATKEIQLEEAKGRGLEYLTGKKEDGMPFGLESDEPAKKEFTKSRPLTELSKKAEEEVNNLSKNMENDRLKFINNATLSNSVVTYGNDTFNEDDIDENKGRFIAINDTLQDLDRGGSNVNERSTLATNSAMFVDKLRKQIRSMSPNQAHAVEEKALASLYKALKSKDGSETKDTAMIQNMKKNTIEEIPDLGFNSTLIN